MAAMLLWPLFPVAAVAARPLEIFDWSNSSSVQWASNEACRVLHAPVGPGTLSLTPDVLEQFDVIFTDDSSKVVLFPVMECCIG